VSLLSSKPEIQYIALKNITLILQTRPEILSSSLRCFYIKYTDPPYVKFEKLLVLERLCTPENVSLVLGEMREYAQEVDVEFVRRVVRCVGGIGVSGGEGAEQCVSLLLEMVKGGVEYIVEEAVVVMKVYLLMSSV
jgi:AP-1 complex subunit beta-1